MEEKRLALITGGTSGIGLGAARKLAASCELALAYADNHERARQAREELEIDGALVRTFARPLRSYEDARLLVEEVQAACGRVPEILVNSAGRIADGYFINRPFGDHEQLVQEHLLVTMALCHLTVKQMCLDRFGRIVNLSSVSAFHAKRGQASYAAAKAALIGFTRTLALEVAHRGVTVNAVAPGLIETPMTQGIIHFLEEDEKRDIKRLVPAGYAGQPEDVGSLIAFLCSAEARYITGAVMVVDGGRSLGDPGS